MKILKFIKKTCIHPIVYLLDMILSLLGVLLIPIVALVFSPWLLYQRGAWKRDCQGKRHLVCLSDFTFSGLAKRGTEHIDLFENEQLEKFTMLCPLSPEPGCKKVSEQITLQAWGAPFFSFWLNRVGLHSLTRLLQEYVTVFRLLYWVVENKVGICRAWTHEYQAFRGGILSRVLDIPLIIDICGNYELLARWSKTTYYFQRFGQLPGMYSIARFFDQLVLGWPLKHCFYMLGRNKNNYEHGFALGASVERSCMLRISNWDAKFLAYDRKDPPACPLDKPYILLVGRLDWDKSPSDIVDCFDQLAGKYPDLHLVIIGDGPFFDAVRERIAQSVDPKRIILTGFLSNEKTYQWTAHAAIGWMPFAGATLTEAMLCECPVLAYDVEWQSELVIHGYTGMLCRFRDLQDTVEKLDWMLANPEECCQMGLRARALAERAFDQKTLVQQEGNLYKRALDSANGWCGGSQQLAYYV